MKYIVSGYIGFDNFGDEAIAYVLSQRLKSEGAEKITYISANPEKTAQLYGVNSCGMLKFFSSLKESDVLISGGGSLLQDVTSFKSLLYYLIVIYAALILHKKVYIYAQGIGPINSTIGKLLTKYALKKVNGISVRDVKSQELLKSWNISSELVKDPILEMEIKSKIIPNTVGIQLRKFKGFGEEFLVKLAEVVKSKFSNKIIKIISLQDSIDLDVCKKFQLILQKQGINNTEVLSNLSVLDAIDKISELECLIAMRFHANVVGINSGIKTVAINYDPKVEKLAKEYKLPLINPNDVVADICNKF